MSGSFVARMGQGASGNLKMFLRPEHVRLQAEAAPLNSIPVEISDVAFEATVAYCEYLWERYRRFPVHVGPFRTVLGFQAMHLDAEFYEKFYREDALSAAQREDFEKTRRGADMPR